MCQVRLKYHVLLQSIQLSLSEGYIIIKRSATIDQVKFYTPQCIMSWKIICRCLKDQNTTFYLIPRYWATLRVTFSSWNIQLSNHNFKVLSQPLEVKQHLFGLAKTKISLISPKLSLPEGYTIVKRLAIFDNMISY